MPRKQITIDDIARGERIRQLREKFGLSQAAVVGRDKREQLSDVERGKNQLTGDFILDVAEGLGLPPRTLEQLRDGAITVEQAAIHRGRTEVRPPPTPAPPEDDPIARLETVAKMLENMHHLSANDAWLHVRGLNLPTTLEMYQVAYDRWQAGSVDVSVNSEIPLSPKAASKVRRQLSRKRKS